MRKFYFLPILILISLYNFAQTPKKPNSSEIYEQIQKLNFLGSVLYVAAHPDDENTHLISYFENTVHARTAYISLTRGDGGQNLIGNELRELLGVIRTEELLAARKIDGGEQFFSRANDFGYSKHPDETFAIWDKQEVLSDLVYVIRKFQPDVIINRFDHRSPGTTHGHHTGSAMLSVEAFDLAKDKNSFSDQLKTVSVWEPKRLFWNQSWFFYGSREKFEKADKSHLVGLDIGTYYPTLGVSNQEIASLSRSQHKSQGFGNTAVRGNSEEYLEIVKGTKPEKDVFEGIDTSWNRVKGGKPIGDLLEKVQREFDFTNPSKSVPELVSAYQMIQKLEDQHWKEIKSEEIKNIISACLGLYLEAVSDDQTATIQDEVQLKIEAINRSEVQVEVEKIVFPDGKELILNQKLENNKDFSTTEKFIISPETKLSNPYWLNEKGSLGLYKVEEQELRGLAETPNANVLRFDLKIAGIPMDFRKPIVYKYNDAVDGEVYKPFAILPKASVQVQEKVILFGNGTPKKVSVKVKSFGQNLNGSLKLKANSDWKISPENQPIQLAKNEEKIFWFEVQPPNKKSEIELIPELNLEGKTIVNQVVEINYPHIPEQFIVLPGSAKIAKLDIQKKGEKIGYIMGAGDEIPESLRQIGYDVQIIQPNYFTEDYLNAFDAVVLGIRAFNTVDELKYKNKTLFNYVENGGTLVVQYNTSREVLTDEVAPFELQLSRDRVTDENSEVKFLAPNHPVLNSPNQITQQDFEGWVQERGLYFPDKWSKEFTPILSMHDKGESALKGSLLVAQHGKGYYVYTGLSFFRELPEGVSGAYRLFANILSLGK